MKPFVFSPPLCSQRYRWATDVLDHARCDSFVDAGCCEGSFATFALSPTSTRRATYALLVDVDVCVLQSVEQRLFNTLYSWLPITVDRALGDCCHCDPSLLTRTGHPCGFHAVVSIEVVEHLTHVREYTANLFHTFCGVDTRVVLLTTPNRDFNVHFGFEEGVFRHPDHRFEFSSDEFESFVFDEFAPHAARAGFSSLVVYDIGGGATQGVVAWRHDMCADGYVPSFATSRRVVQLDDASQVSPHPAIPCFYGEYSFMDSVHVEATDPMALLIAASIADAGDSVGSDAHDVNDLVPPRSSPGPSFLRYADQIPVAALKEINNDKSPFQLQHSVAYFASQLPREVLQTLWEHCLQHATFADGAQRLIQHNKKHRTEA